MRLWGWKRFSGMGMQRFFQCSALILGLTWMAVGCAQSQPTKIAPGETVNVSPEMLKLMRAAEQLADTDPKLAKFKGGLQEAVAQTEAGNLPSRTKTFKEQQEEEAKRPMNWQTRFTFEGQIRPGPYSVDPHIWVYTKEFAERFGMPMEWVDSNLKGVEAAAWRKTKTGYVTCGWGGKKDACKEEDAAVLELYFDSNKVKLPWAPWSEEFQHLSDRLWGTSTRFLTTQRCEHRRQPTSTPLYRRPDPQRNCVENTYRTPFSDPQNGEEIHLYEKGISYSGQGNRTGMAAYDKRAYPNLAWVQIGYTRPVGLFNPPEAAVLTLETRDAPLGKTLQQYYKIILPEDFDRRIKAKLDSQREAEREFYKKSLDMK